MIIEDGQDVIAVGTGVIDVAGRGLDDPSPAAGRSAEDGLDEALAG
jgi:hypothetical protein